MGIFFERPALTNTAVTGALRSALAEDPKTLPDVDGEAAKRADQLQSGGSGFQGGRFLIAIVILGAFVVGAVITDAKGYDDSSKALYGFATTILGVIVGLLGGEKSANS